MSWNQSKPAIGGPIQRAVGILASRVVSIMDTWTVEGEGGMCIVDILAASVDTVEIGYLRIWNGDLCIYIAFTCISA